ncbi:MAG: autotransporter domain-containing protein [Haliea sp.]|nr:autotransporter domain-containing protein [Haliea sp.]
MNFVGEFNNNADITGGNGTAFDASATTNGMVLNHAAGTITGDVLLGSGNDRVNITGGSINGRIIGQGFGTVAIDVGAGNEFIGNGLVDVAEYVIQSGTVHQMADFSTAATTTTVASGATLSFNSLITGGGALVSNGELEFVLSPGSKGELVQAGTVTLNDGSTISAYAQGLSPTLNESFLLISATSLLDNGVVLAEDAFGSLLYDFEALITNDSLSVVTSVADLGTVSPLQNPSAFGDSMTAFVSGGGDNAVVELLAGLDTGDVQGFEQVADVFSPSVSGAVSQGAREANDSTWRLINERFVGSSAPFPDSEPPNGLWLQGYGGTTDQDAIDDVEGFDADTTGVAVGYDLDLNQWRIGAAFSAGETNIDNDRFASDRIDIESNQLIVYGGFRQDQWFANATASAAALDYDFKRNNLVAGEGPLSDTDGDLLGMSVGGGLPIQCRITSCSPRN